MADVKISALPASSTPLAGTEVLPIVQGGVTDQVSVANLTAGRAVSAASLLATAATTSSSTQGAVAYGTLSYSDVNHLATFQTSVASYAQVEIQNTSTDPAASADMVVGNNLTTASTYYGDFGINSSGWAGSGPFNTANTVYLTSTTAPLSIGTTDSNIVNFATNSTTAASISTGQIFSTVNDATIHGITIGLGNGAVSTNTAVGKSVIAAAATGTNNVGMGWQALNSLTSGSYNTAIGGADSSGFSALVFNTTGPQNTAFGAGALSRNTTATGSTAVGYQALTLSNRTSDGNAFNTAIGYQAGSGITTGQFNTIIGRYDGASAPISATGSNYIVLADGNSNVRAYFNGSIAIFNGTISPVQAATASAPAYVKGAIYFDTTLNKLRVGGATAWETITSV